jgi:hypothetical protein
MYRLALRTAALGAAAALSMPALSGATVRADGAAVPLAPPPALDAANFKPFKVAKIERLTADTAKYTFALPGATDELGLTVSSFLLVKADIDGVWAPDGASCSRGDPGGRAAARGPGGPG